jgi:excisionase family DNA binding protein
MTVQTVASTAPTRLAGSPWPLIEAARFLGISHRHLVRLIDGGKIQPIRLGRRVLLSDAEVRRIATQGIS